MEHGLGSEGFVMALLATSLPEEFGEGLGVGMGMSTSRVTCKEWEADWVRREMCCPKTCHPGNVRLERVMMCVQVCICV